MSQDKGFDPGQVRDLFGRWKGGGDAGKPKLSDSFAGVYHRQATAAAEATIRANEVGGKGAHQVAADAHEKARNAALDAGYVRRAERHERAAAQHVGAMNAPRVSAIRIISPHVVPAVTEALTHAATSGTRPSSPRQGHAGSGLPKAKTPTQAAREYWAARGVPKVGAAARSRGGLQPAHAGTYAVRTKPSA